MKKISMLFIMLVLCLGLVGCTKGDVEPENSDIGNKYIDLVTIYKNEYKKTEVVYDKNTKVMYFIRRDAYRFGITPIYNSDGTVKLYEEE